MCVEDLCIGQLYAGFEGIPGLVVPVSFKNCILWNPASVKMGRGYTMYKDAYNCILYAAVERGFENASGSTTNCISIVADAGSGFMDATVTDISSDATGNITGVLAVDVWVDLDSDDVTPKMGSALLDLEQTSTRM